MKDGNHTNPSSSIPPPSSSSKPRILFVDMFRGLITLIMVQGHVTNSTILYSLRSTKSFHYLDVLNGMVAPSFIFIAGFAFTLALEKKWEDFLGLHRPFWLQIRRLLFILAVGYWLHLPIWSFRSLLHFNQEQLLYVLRADVLQLIALSLLLSLLLVVTLRNKKVVILTLLALALLNIFLTPFIYEIDPRETLPKLPAGYINSHYYALFPLFPWSAYAFLGTFVCWIYLQARRANREKTFFTVMAIAGAVMFFGGFALFYAPWQYYTYADPSKSSPRSFMLKMGFIFLTLSANWLYERRRKPESSWLNVIGQESLFVYGLHLLIAYGSVFTAHSIAADVGPHLTFLPSLLISLLLISSMALTGIGWHRLKSSHPRAAKLVFYLLCAVFFIRFFAA